VTRRPTTLTLALTAIVPETTDPEVGEVMVTIRLPSCASACCGETDQAARIVRRAAARLRDRKRRAFIRRFVIVKSPRCAATMEQETANANRANTVTGRVEIF